MTAERDPNTTFQINGETISLSETAKKEVIQKLERAIVKKRNKFREVSKWEMATNL